VHRSPVRPLQIEPDMFIARQRLNDVGSVVHIGFEVGSLVGGSVGQDEGFLEGSFVGC